MDTEVSPRKIPMDHSALERLKRAFIALDLETTGPDSLKDRIVEIGAARFVNGQAAETFCALVRPDAPASPSATRIQNITNETLSHAPSEADAVSMFIEFIGDALDGKTVMCAHNARLIFNFLRRALTRCRVRSKILYVDTLTASKSVISGLDDYSLETVRRRLRLPHSHARQAHRDRALAGALRCGEMMRELLPLLEMRGPSFDEYDGGSNRPGKGRHVIDCPENYCVVAIETTGRSVTWDRVTEVAALKFHNRALTDAFSASIKPDDSDAKPVWLRFMNFIGNSVLVGHSLHLDIDFLYDSVSRCLHLPLSNDYISASCLARRFLPHLSHHGLYALADYYNCRPITFHGALSKSQMTAQCYAKLVDDILNIYGSAEEFRAAFNYKSKPCNPVKKRDDTPPKADSK